jgi:hypothetical protein
MEGLRDPEPDPIPIDGKTSRHSHACVEGHEPLRPDHLDRLIRGAA